jgi:tetratricopeptide (TPR) repeat protein
MSSRVPYTSPEFEAAIVDASALEQWEKAQFQHYRSRTEGKSAVHINDLLACAELAIRCKDVACADECLDKAHKIRPQDPDVHYLLALRQAAQNNSEQALTQLQTAITSITHLRTPDMARLYRLLAQLTLSHSKDLLQAAQHLRKGAEIAGGIPFVHCTTRDPQHVTEEQLSFDLAVFDHLFSWEGFPATVKFASVATDSRQQVYVLEHSQRWVFQFNGEGQFIRGLTERQLAGVPFVFPEHSWSLNDIAVAPDGRIFVAGSNDRIHVFGPDWRKLIAYNPPASDKPLRPISLACDTKGTLYVLYLNLPGIHMFAPEGAHLGSFGANTTMPSTDKNYFCGLATDEAGKVYLYDRIHVQVYNPTTGALEETYDVPDSSPEHLDHDDYPFCWNGASLDHNGYLYLANTYEENIAVLDQYGNSFEMIDRMNQQLQTFSLPMDVAVDSQDTLYIADTGNARVVKRSGNEWTQLLGHPAWTSTLKKGA